MFPKRRFIYYFCCDHYFTISYLLLIIFLQLNVLSMVRCQISNDVTTSVISTEPASITTTTVDYPTTTESNFVGIDNDPCNEVDTYGKQPDGILCRSHSDCQIFNQYCCPLNTKKICMKPQKRINPTTHQPLLGVIPRECPEEPIPEPFAVRNCTKDTDCWPRICCPDGNSSYCRIPQPPWRRISAPRIVEPIRNIMAYMQCTPPPPPLYDLFPKMCRTTLDCFPNLCCQEQNRKVCRPPRRSLLALISTLGRRQ